MSYVLKTLAKDEKIEISLNLHWMNYALAGVVFFIAILGCIASYIIYHYMVQGWVMAMVCAVLGFFFMLGAVYMLLMLYTREMVVTNKRVISRWGIISVRTDELKNSKIESVEIKQSLLGRILGYGTLWFSGTGTSKVRFENVENPWEARRQIETLIGD